MSDTRIAVVMITRNRGDQIRTALERQLAMTGEGDELISKVYKRLFERTSPILIKMLMRVVNGGIKSLNIEINTKDMECFCFVTCSKNIGETLH